MSIISGVSSAPTTDELSLFDQMMDRVAKNEAIGEEEEISQFE
jgi:hypothetical protein